jgi:streptogramin lyase
VIPHLHSLRPLIFILPLVFLISGCAITSTVPNSSARGMSLHGKVHGGQQPIAGAHVYLLAADSGGYGNPSDSLLDPGITGLSDSVGAYVATDSNGNWDITGDYSCTPNTQVYLYALGGDPGAGVNSASGLMAVLGNCPSTGSFAATIPYVSINEVSTVAAAYAMAGYAVDATHVASSGTPLALTGIANAFANASNLADLPTGTALATTPNGNGGVPTAQINLLANIIAACINSTGPSSGNCTTLLGDATSDGTTGGAAPADTATAMINIAHNPGANMSDLYNLPPAFSPFAPTPSSQPNDLTLSLVFGGGGIRTPTSVAVDASGNLWVTNAFTSSVSILSSLGVPLSNSPLTGNGVGYPSQVAIDGNGDAWISNNGGMDISEFDFYGNPVSGSPFTGGGLHTPYSLAIDATGDVWVASPYTNNVTLLGGSSGSPALTGITGDGLSDPYGVAIDHSGNVWIVNEGGNSVTILDHTGAPLVNSPVTGDGIDHPFAVSIDGSGNAWISNFFDSTLTVLDHTGTAITGSPFSAGGLNLPICVAFDGAGNVWVANDVGQGVTELTSAGTPIAGSPFVAPSLANPYFIAVDGSGSVWLANQNGDSLTELIGAAVPTVTPIASALAANSIGARP